MPDEIDRAEAERLWKEIDALRTRQHDVANDASVGVFLKDLVEQLVAELAKTPAAIATLTAHVESLWKTRKEDLTLADKRRAEDITRTRWVIGVGLSIGIPIATAVATIIANLFSKGTP